jgi:hypothetical protein
MTIETIDRETYERERAICDKARAYAEKIMCEGSSKRKRNYMTADEAAHPDYAACDNDMRGRVEQYEILNNPPETFVAYIDSDNAASVWTGRKVSTSGVCTSSWRVNSHYRLRMYQYRFKIAGREYTGRGLGKGMAIVLRETAASKRKRKERHAAAMAQNIAASHPDMLCEVTP